MSLNQGLIDGDSNKRYPSLTNVSTISKNAFSVLNFQTNDSLKNEILKQKIKTTYKNKNWEEFNLFRFEHIALLKKIKDSSSLAKTYDYSGAYFRRINKADSSYFYYLKSYEIYNQLRDSLSTGKVLLNIAILQKNIHAYKASEETSFKALSLLENLNYPRRTSSALNNLGIVYNQLKDKENAINFHTMALDLRLKMKGTKLYYLHSLNNLAKAHRDYGDYGQALFYFNKIFEFEQLLLENQKFKAVVLDNYAYTLFKQKKYNDAKIRLEEALDIRETLNDKNGIIISAIHLSEYYSANQDTITAIQFAKRAEALSIETQNFRDYLESLELMSNLYETKEAKTHFNKYIKIRDSLDLKNNKQKESFARIKYELDEKQTIISDQNKELKIKTNSILAILGAVLIVLFLIYYNRAKNKRRLQNEKLNIAANFKDYLIDKYDLTKQNIEFWELWVTKLSQEDMSERLHITTNAIKSRRKSLRKKINAIETIDGDFDQALAIIIWNKNKETFSSIK